jgi:hypothetical protein
MEKFEKQQRKLAFEIIAKLIDQALEYEKGQNGLNFMSTKEFFGSLTLEMINMKNDAKRIEKTFKSLSEKTADEKDLKIMTQILMSDIFQLVETAGKMGAILKKCNSELDDAIISSISKLDAEDEEN